LDSHVLPPRSGPIWPPRSRAWPASRSTRGTRSRPPSITIACWATTRPTWQAWPAGQSWTFWRASRSRPRHDGRRPWQWVPTSPIHWTTRPGSTMTALGDSLWAPVRPASVALRRYCRKLGAGSAPLRQMAWRPVGCACICPASTPGIRPRL